MVMPSLKSQYQSSPLFDAVDDGLRQLFALHNIRQATAVYKPDDILPALLPIVYEQWGITPLFSGLMPEAVERAIYANAFFLLRHLTLAAAVERFARITNTDARWRLDKRNMPGDPTHDAVTGVTMYIHPLIPFELTAEIQAYFKRAYEFLLTDGLVITIVVSELSRFEPGVLFKARARQSYTLPDR